MQFPILNGIYSDDAPELRTSYPVNLEPVPKKSGISNGFLRPSSGIVSSGTGAGFGRGGILWNGILYRVMGTKFCSISSDGNVTIIGDVGGSPNEIVTMNYSFDRLGIASGGDLYYFDGSVLTRVIDANLGIVKDVIWIDGYFMTTDGTSLIVTELNDPTQVDPFKYGSSEVNPDPVIALKVVDNEVYALNRHTIEVFDNIGGTVFPFARIDGALISKGVIGKNACCVFLDAIAFMGGAQNESASIYLGKNGTEQKISTDEIDKIISTYSEQDLSRCQFETINQGSHRYLYIHLPDRTLAYDAGASSELGIPVWFTLVSTLNGFVKYRARNFIWAYNRWNVEDTASNSVGYLSRETSQHWGDDVRWEFGTNIIYNEGRGAIVNELELVALTGRVDVGLDPVISTSYSLDGMSFSQEKYINAGTTGDRLKRLVWFRQGSMRHIRTQRFRGDSKSRLSFIRLEANMEGLLT